MKRWFVKEMAVVCRPWAEARARAAEAGIRRARAALRGEMR